MGNTEDKDMLTVAEALRVCWRWAWVIALVVVVFSGAGAGYSAVQTPTYTASSLILIRQPQVNDPNSDAQGIQFEVEGLKAITPTMARALVSRPVIEDAISQLDLSTTPEALADHLEAEPLADTQFISISYEDSSPQRAQRVVNTIGDVSSKQLSALSPIATPVSAVVWERALVPTEPVGPSIWIIGSLALATGLIFGVLLAFMLEGLSKAGVLRKRHGKW